MGHNDISTKSRGVFPPIHMSSHALDSHLTTLVPIRPFPCSCCFNQAKTEFWLGPLTSLYSSHSKHSSVRIRGPIRARLKRSDLTHLLDELKVDTVVELTELREVGFANGSEMLLEEDT